MNTRLAVMTAFLFGILVGIAITDTSPYIKLLPFFRAGLRSAIFVGLPFGLLVALLVWRDKRRARS